MWYKVSSEIDLGHKKNLLGSVALYDFVNSLKSLNKASVPFSYLHKEHGQ